MTTLRDEPESNLAAISEIEGEAIDCELNEVSSLDQQNSTQEETFMPSLDSESQTIVFDNPQEQ